MHAGFSNPSNEQRGAGSVVPKILAVLVAAAVIKMIVGARHHGGGSRFSRRRQAIAEFHRALHAEDEAQGATTKA